jgi:hypothetical protein
MSLYLCASIIANLVVQPTRRNRSRRRRAGGGDPAAFGQRGRATGFFHGAGYLEL